MSNEKRINRSNQKKFREKRPKSGGQSSFGAKTKNNGK